MAKKVTRIAKLQFEAGKAKPGPELAGLGIDMAGFTKDFNDATRDRMGDIVPVVITAYSDRTYAFVLKTTPAAVLLIKAAGIKKGAGNSLTTVAGEVTLAQLEEIAKYKLEDLNTHNLESAIKMLKGTARNMGIHIKDEADDKEAAQSNEAASDNQEEINNG